MPEPHTSQPQWQQNQRPQHNGTSEKVGKP
uniref:Uncharacterized protein n=1 Tax=Anguilla anguilla TaxID=7936 RepID=A0A0E9TGK3_ANGAN